ncbi:hypothetical protein [Brevundimonas sp.]|uniref:hypothetical protein n=1 Tax=Brevundimonas sp. TaxID=1871086 RepID=UPI001DA9EBEC|nr:hypothetical protein [Brevundimonas sp.]MBL0946946.1 hypothetical protein [Brevundimonas sp.]
MVRHLSAAAIGLYLLILPVAATAQSVSVEAARDHADAIIASSRGAAFLTNVTDSTLPRVRHGPSGMVCEFPGADARDNIRVFDRSGLDIGCGSWRGSTFVTLFATRYDEVYTPEEVMESAIRALRNGAPDARPVDRNFSITTLPGQPQPLLAVFDMSLSGQPVRSLILVRHIGEWSFKARGTGPSTDDTVVEVSSMALARALPREAGSD